jgi:tetratricopeptide (TPR) repeat protein
VAICKLILWGTIAAAALASFGCMGGGGVSPLSSASPAAASQHIAQQTATQSNGSLASPVFGGAAAESGAPSISQALWNNPVSRAVKGAFSGSVIPASHASGVVSPDDPLSLSHPTKPPTPELYASMGLMAEHAGNLEKAREFYQKAIAMRPGNADALLAYGHFEDRQGRLAEAAKLYRAALDADPQHAAALNDLGLCFARQGQLPQALELVRQAARLRPDRHIYRNNIARVLVEMGRADEAANELAAVLPPAQAQYNIGWFLAQSGRNQEAARHFALAVDIDPQMTYARAWLAKLQPESIASEQPTSAGGRVTHLPSASEPAANSAYADLPVVQNSGQNGPPDYHQSVVNRVGGVPSASSGYQASVAGLPSPSTSSTPTWSGSGQAAERSVLTPQHGTQLAPSTSPYQDRATSEAQQLPGEAGSPATSDFPAMPSASRPPASAPSHFNGQSHESPWGAIPSPYTTSAITGGALRHPASIVSQTTWASPDTNPNTVVNPYYVSTPDQATVRQASTITSP